MSKTLRPLPKLTCVFLLSIIDYDHRAGDATIIEKKVLACQNKQGYNSYVR